MALLPSRSSLRVAVVGDGPAGTAVATHLARAGARVVLFARGRPAGLVVGESLVPGVVPRLRELGIEDEVRGYATRKPGATFVVADGSRVAIDFASSCTSAPPYAYNVPRDRLDASLLAACEKSGAQIVREPAHLERAPRGGDGVALAGESRAAAASALGAPPDFVVDATGRARAVARLLDLPTEAGPRRDTALFAHCEGVAIDAPGHVHTDQLARGWCWRIPLPGRVSLGVVAPPDALAAYGPTAERQYDALLATEPRLREVAAGARRITPVLRYSNYQLATRRGAGANWALAGDAFGFVDPVFSSGLHLALSSARALADALLRGSTRALRGYERRHLRHLRAWQRAVDLYYDGRFVALLAMRDRAPQSLLGRAFAGHLDRHLPRVFTGEGSAGLYDPWLLGVVARAAAREPVAAVARVSD